jgi:hypothetical protein
MNGRKIVHVDMDADSTHCCVNRSVAVEINLEACSSF